MEQVVMRLQDYPRILRLIGFAMSDRGSKALKVTGAVALIYAFWPTKSKSSKLSKPSDGKPKYHVSQMIELLKIVIPGWKSKEIWLLILLTLSLVARTFLSIYVAVLDGKIVKSIVNRSPRDFVKNLFIWYGIGIPATYINSIIRYLENTTSLAFRTRLVNHCYDLYASKETYYKIGNLDNRLLNVDQCLTEDINKFAFKLAHLYSQLTKPALDAVLMTYSLFMMARQTTSGGAGSAGILGLFVVFITAKVLKFFQPPFGRMATRQAELEGDLRFAHSRLITNAEEVAFFRGDKIEKRELQNKYYALAKHILRTNRTRIFYHMLEGFFMKYVWSSTGLIMIALPQFLFERRNVSSDSELVTDRTKSFITSKKLLIDIADAIERMMLSIKEINELGGYTVRVWEMVRIFKEVQSEHYQNPMLQKLQTSHPTLANGRGKIFEDSKIIFDKVPIVSPAGDVLVAELSFSVQPGEHLLITGPNGCGKSSLFRILGGLWPSLSGVVHRPPIRDIFYLPQRPYLTVGTLRDEIIYPDSLADMKTKRFTDQELFRLLEAVHLTHILDREGGWDICREWKDVLSGGEKQRLGMARLLYHKPKFAILDECTSAVSIDVEGQIYQELIDKGITLLTVSHRPSLWKYHKFLLLFDGEGGTKFTALNAEERLSLKDEKTSLEAQLQGIPKMQVRLAELCKLLGEDSVALLPAPQTSSTTTSSPS